MLPKKPNRKQQNLNQPTPPLTRPELKLEPKPQLREPAPVADKMPNEEEPASVSAEEKAEEKTEEKAPKFIEIKQPRSLSQTSNASGEVFNLSDQIRVRAPWGHTATAEIAAFYKDESGNIWAQYKPVDSQPNWSWEGGCVRAALLIKA